MSTGASPSLACRFCCAVPAFSAGRFGIPIEVQPGFSFNFCNRIFQSASLIKPAEKNELDHDHDTRE
jgi:hypothetical protein